MRIVKEYPLLKLLHHTLFTYPSPTNLSYFWNFGVCALVCLIIQIITGIFLAMHYIPEGALAFWSVEHIMRDVNYGWLLRYVHANGASMFFFVVYLHIFRNFFFTSYVYPRELLWCSGVIILLVMIITAFLGYVLPWGQMSFWAATVITNLVTANYLVIWLWGSFSVSTNTLTRFFSLHYLLPFVLLILVFLHLVFLHENGSNNPLGIGFKTDDMGFGPYYIWKDLYGLFVFFLLYLFLVFFSPNFLGHSDNYILANALVTPFHIVPEWYFLPFYAILRSVPDKLLGVLLLLSAIVALLFLPFIVKIEKRSFYYSPILKILFWFFVINCIFLGWLGGKPIEYPFLFLSQTATLFYFFYLIILLPLFTEIDKILLNKKNKISSKFFYYLKVEKIKVSMNTLNNIKTQINKYTYKTLFFKEYKIGALTLDVNRLSSRTWEAIKIESIEFLTSINARTRVDYYGMKIQKILPYLTKKKNEWIKDSIRFSFDSLYNQRLTNYFYKNNTKKVQLKLIDLFIIKKNYFYKNFKKVGILGDNLDFISSVYIKKISMLLGDINIFLKYDIPLIISEQRLFFFKEDSLKKKNIFFFFINFREEYPNFYLNFKDNCNFFLGGSSTYLLNKNYIFIGKNILNINYLFLGKSRFSKELIKDSLIFLGKNFFSKNKSLLSLLSFNKLNFYYILSNNSYIQSMELFTSSWKKEYFYNNQKYMLSLYNKQQLNSSFINSFIIYYGFHGVSNLIYNLLIPINNGFEKKLYYLNCLGLLSKTSVGYNIFELKSLYFILLSFLNYYINYISLSLTTQILSYYKKIILLKTNQQHYTFFIFLNYLQNSFEELLFESNNWYKYSKNMGIFMQFYLNEKKKYWL